MEETDADREVEELLRLTKNPKTVLDNITIKVEKETNPTKIRNYIGAAAARLYEKVEGTPDETAYDSFLNKAKNRIARLEKGGRSD